MRSNSVPRRRDLDGCGGRAADRQTQRLQRLTEAAKQAAAADQAQKSFNQVLGVGVGAPKSERRSRYSSSSACARTDRRCCSPSSGWAGSTTDAWRAVLDDLTSRGLRRPQFVIVDGGAGLACALAAVWNDVPVQRCTVHKHRNLLACAPERLHDEITADYTDMTYAATPQDIADRRKAFIRKWRLRHKAVADSLEEAGDALFAFAALPP